MGAMNGQCMCGAVKVQAEATKSEMTACVCDNCRRWTGGVNFAFEVDAASAEMTGPIRTVSVEPWAERGFCGDCGSGLFYRVLAPGPMQGMLKMSAGLFPDATGLPVGTEYYSDQRPDAFDLSHPHQEITADAVRAIFAGQT